MKQTILFFTMILPFCMISQNITNIFPTQAMQNQTVSLVISGNNMSFSGFSCWSNTGNISDFRFSQFSGTNILYGTPTNTSGQQLNGSLSVPSFQATGVYNLEVFDCFNAWWIQFPNSFEILAAAGTPASWNCTNNSCIDPGNGNGTFTTLASCQANCVIQPSWDCFPNSDPAIYNCIDPGTGTGAYTVLSFCEAACSTNAIYEEVSDVLIYPNPAQNTLTIDGNYISATIYNIFGKGVSNTFFNQKTIDIAVLNNGVYFLHINKNNSISIKKITISK
tara:strand:+ start:807 stop:1640 length:834 start_codon:yes stop_codon:yes gene_type:complete